MMAAKKKAKAKPKAKANTPAKMGRPTTFRPEIGRKICEQISSGRALAEICRDKGMPSTGMVHKWIRNKNLDDFSTAYRAARQEQMEGWADEILDISGSSEHDVMRSRLMVDTRKWLMSKLLPQYRDNAPVISDARLVINFAAVLNTPPEGREVIEAEVEKEDKE